MFVNRDEVGVNDRSLGTHGKQILLLTSGDDIQMLVPAYKTLTNILLEHLL